MGKEESEMKESKLTTDEMPNKPKKITINVEKKAEMVIEREEGKPPNVKGGKGPFDTPPELDLNNLPPDTVIFTHHSPGCGYYYFSHKWWYI